jgi:hypothetical protein
MVAHWWLTGSSDRNENRWSAYSLRYVNKVMRLYSEAGGGAPTTATIQNTATSVVYQGSWASARHGRYSGGTVSYATTAGASATLRFTGTKVVWYGPTGPTRGKAKVIVDGKLVRTVDLGTKRFSSRVALFSKSWTTAGKHTVRIEVVGTPGRKLVAIDSFSVRN